MRRAAITSGLVALALLLLVLAEAAQANIASGGATKTVTPGATRTTGATVAAVANSAPVASAGADRSVTVNASTQLTGMSCTDADGTTPTPTVTEDSATCELTNAGTLTPSILCTAEPDTVNVQLCCDDGIATPACDTRIVTVEAAAGTPLPNDATIYSTMSNGTEAFWIADTAYLDCDGDGVCGEAGDGCVLDSPVSTWCNGNAPGTHNLVCTGTARPLWKPTGGPDGGGHLQFDGVDDICIASGFSIDELAGTDNSSLQIVGKFDTVIDVVSHGVALGTYSGAFLNAQHIRTTSTGDIYRSNGALEAAPHNVDYLTPEASNDVAWHLHETHAYETGLAPFYDGTAQATGGGGGINTSGSAAITELRVGGSTLGQYLHGGVAEVVLTEARTSTQATNYRTERACVAYPSISIAGCNTPLAIYSPLVREDLPAALSTYAEPTLPTTIGSEVTVTTSAGLVTAAGTAGALIRVTASFADVTTLAGATDVDIIVADGVSIGGINFTTGSDDVRVRGAGSTSRCNVLRAADSTDVTFDSLLVKTAASGFTPIRLHEVQRAAFIAIVGVPDSASTGTHSVGFFDGSVVGTDDVLIADCNFGAIANAGVNDWFLRMTDLSDRIIIVDSTVEARAGQPVVRRTGATNGLFVYRSRVINLYEPRSVMDATDGALTDRHSNAYVQNTEIWLASLGGVFASAGFGGINVSATEYSDIFEGQNLTWHTEATGNPSFVDDATLATMESSERDLDSWEYRLGTPVYNNGAGATTALVEADGYAVMHPGWTAPTSPNTGLTMGTASPYDL